MKLEIEPFINKLGWFSDGDIVASMLNGHRDYISGRLPSSLVFYVPEGNQGKAIEKTIRPCTATGITAVISGALCNPKMLYGDCENVLPPQIDGSLQSNVTFDRTTEQVYKGTYARKLVKTSAVGLSGYYGFVDNTNPADMHGFSAGRAYRLSCRLRCPTGGPLFTQIKLQLQYYDTSWHYYSMTPNAYDVWQLLTVQVAIPANATGVFASLVYDTSVASGKYVYADEIGLQSPVRVTAMAHPFSNGDLVKITEVGGMVELNEGVYSVYNKTTNGFELYYLDGVNFVDGSVLTPYTSGGSAEKMTAITDFSDYTELVLCLWSRNRRGQWFMKPTDFSYTISVDGVKEFYLPTFQGFCDVTISLSGITSINQIRITALHDEEDYLLCSGMYAIHDEYPLDVLQAIEDELKEIVTQDYPDGILVGTLQGEKLSEKIVISGYRDFLDRYAVIKIKEGAVEEYHQLRDYDESGWTFYGNLDGVMLLNAYSSAEVYLQFPVRITLGETDAIFPSISIQGMEPTPILRSSGAERLVDSFDMAGQFSDRRDDLLLQYPVLIDCEARHYEILARLNRVARGLLGQYKLWINGRKHDFMFDIPPRQLDPTIPIEILPKTQYTVLIEVKELREAREVLPAAAAVTSTYNLEKPGVLS